MPRKFISFLGATPYRPMVYYFDGKTELASSPTFYVQKAIFENVLKDWRSEDKIYIFTTNDAFQNNYENRITQFNPEKKWEYGDGLQKVLTDLREQGIVYDFESVFIPDGNSEEEIWKIFTNVFNKLSEGDRLYFDITYGFRSLPMLGMVLLDYAKTIHGVQIEKIFYGNYEANKNVNGKQMAPVLDLTPFAELQDWTAASRAFLKGGNAEQLADLCAVHNTTISDNLRQFAPSILTCRGTQLHRDLDISSFKNLLDSTLNSSIAAQLRPLLEKVQEKLTPFESDNLQNGLHAVKWCIDNGLIQQGYTFLQETVISLILEQALSIDAVLKEGYRNAANAALNGISTHAVNLKNPVTRVEYGIIYNHVQTFRGLTTTYKRLTGEHGLRNDINHCGYRERYASSMELKEDLSEIYNKISRILLP